MKRLEIQHHCEETFEDFLSADDDETMATS